jgi:ubiquinone/menaquinone biosynthesis C-methylase UbiE
VASSEEASVALYSLGNAALLNEATDELVARLTEWQLVDRDRMVLDVGCGIGRLELALSPLVRRMTGIDVSGKMIETARRRSAGLANVTFELVSGVMLPFSARSFDLVLAVDSLPYLVGLGPAMIDANFREFARVLPPGGDLAILGFSYRDDPERDRRDVAELAERHRFDVLDAGSAPFRLWNAHAFRLRRGRGTG